MAPQRGAWAISALLGLIPLSLSGCGQGEELTGPPPAQLRVTTATGGMAPDPDGYTVSIDGLVPAPIGPVDTLLESSVTPGDHTVDLAGLSSGCTVEGGSSRTVTAAAGTVVSADFAITCNAPEPSPTGAIVVTLSTSGVDLDPDGYVVAVDPAQSRVTGASDQIRLEAIPAGSRSVRLSGLAANCSVQGPNPLTVEVPADGEAAASFAVRCWPPPTGRIAFVRSSGFLEPGSLLLLDPSGSVLDEFAPGDVLRAPAWSPDRSFIAVSGSSAEFDQAVFVQPLSGAAAVSLGGCFPPGDRPVWSRDASRLLCLTTDGLFGSRLYSVRRDDTSPRFLTPDGMVVHSARVVADGRVFLTADDPETGLAVFSVSLTGSGLTRLFALPGDVNTLEDRVVPSPDGSRVAFIRFRFNVRTELYIVGSSGGDPRLLSGELDVSSLETPAWAPDGSRIAFAVGNGGNDRIWLVDPDGSNLAPVTLPGPLGFSAKLAWSPDGTRLAIPVGSNDLAQSSIYTIRADGSGLERLTATSDYDSEPAWGP
jgi:dipeptidyl aminopeptidase/acylaminoacyl peptidase